jgi:hypothetical protein
MEVEGRKSFPPPKAYKTCKGSNVKWSEAFQKQERAGETSRPKTKAFVPKQKQPVAWALLVKSE